MARDCVESLVTRGWRFLHQLLRIELVPILVDESQLREWHPILLPNNLPYRIAEPNNREGFETTRNRKVSAHLLILNPSVDSGNNPLLPRRQLHVLDSPTSVNKVE